MRYALAGLISFVGGYLWADDVHAAWLELGLGFVLGIEEEQHPRVWNGKGDRKR